MTPGPPEPTELWTAPRGMRCILVPFYCRYQIRLMRGHETIRTHVLEDEEAARSVAAEWQRQLQALEPQG